jgi:alpha-D-ribose 1-methylphosphonate 5-triphosphate diphosphatase
MTLPDLRLTGAQVLTPQGLADQPLALGDGLITDATPRREVDLTGFLVLPGIVDMHGDAFEKHLAPRRGAMKDLDQGLIATEAELAANGITTATLAQFYSWEGGMRGAEFAGRVFDALAQVRPRLVTDLRAQLRFETPMLEAYQAVREVVAAHDIAYVVFNDHLPHEALAKGKRPPRLTGQALRIGRNPEKHLEYMQALHAGMDQVPAALDALCADLAARGVLMGSHDDHTAQDRATWRARGVRLSEFPETLDAAEAAHDAGDAVVLGAPNTVRGGSHKGNVSATDLIVMGYCDALASDYHYPSPLRAAFRLEELGICDLAPAWRLVSSGPAKLLGLEDRGELTPGKRADLIVVDPDTRRVVVTIAGGQVAHLTGPVAQRFLRA